MNRQQFSEIGEVIFGEKWKTPLARALGLKPQDIRDMSRGKKLIPRGVSLVVTAIARQKIDCLSSLLKEADIKNIR